MAQFEIYRDSSDDYRWRLRTENGNIIADSGQGYSRRTDCENGIEAVKKKAPGAELVDQVEDRR